ncbi:MAG: SDR family oxidoreductase [Pseudomonadota bacterium]
MTSMQFPDIQFDFSGKTAIVTGSTGGIGQDIARVLHGYGANVVVTGRSAQEGQAIADDLGDRAIFQKLDVTQDDQIDACIARALDAFGDINFHINNACFYPDPGLEATREDWLNSVNVNLISGAIFVAKVAPHLKAAGGGVIINLSSTSAKSGRAGSLLYPASKAAILVSTKNEAVTLAKDNIRVLAVIPAWTWSPSIEKATGDIDTADRIGATFHPSGRIGRGEEVAQAVAFACSSGASFMTGTEILVDGGYTVVGPDQGKDPRIWLRELAAKD